MVSNLIRHIIKAVWGVDGISLFLKKQKKNLMKKIYIQKYSANDLVEIMSNMGMKKGAVVFIHSSMTEFYNYTGTAEELIEKIIEIIGEDGTLLMPAYPQNKFKLINDLSLNNNQVISFDVNITPSGAGYLSEVFRKYPGVKRSINLQHSVCAYGKLAEYFISEHHLSITAWDEFSPYYKISQMNTLIFSFGLPKMLGTSIHCVESILRTKYVYFQQFFTKEIKYKFLDENNQVFEHCFLTNKNVTKTNKDKIVKKYFKKTALKRQKISNLTIHVIDAKYLFDTLLDLANRGITIYTKPDPEKFKINGVFVKIEEDCE